MDEYKRHLRRLAVHDDALLGSSWGKTTLCSSASTSGPRRSYASPRRSPSTPRPPRSSTPSRSPSQPAQRATNRRHPRGGDTRNRTPHASSNAPRRSRSRSATTSTPRSSDSTPEELERRERPRRTGRAHPSPHASSTPFRPAKPDPLLSARGSRWRKSCRGYRAPTARRDPLAGVTVAALALPSAMAYAELAGLSPR